MKAVAIYEHGGLDKMIYGDVPTPEPGPGDALVRIRAVGVNHFDHDIREGYSGIDHPKPHVLGVEGVGEVVAYGPGTSGPDVGTRVAINGVQACGVCVSCKSGFDGVCEQGILKGVTAPGCYAEFAISRADNLLPLPDALSFEHAAASMICGGTAWHMVVTLGQIKAGEDVLVNAAGSGVGTFAVQIAALHGAHVIASAGSDKKLKRARDLGAHDVINYTTQDLAAEAVRLTGGRGPALVIESVGGDVLTKSLEAVPRRGRIITCGAHAGETVDLDVIALFRKHVTLQGSHYASRNEVSHVLRLVAEGALKPCIHSVMPLADAAKAAALTANRQFFGKMVLVP